MQDTTTLSDTSSALERVFVAHLLARPDLLPAVQPDSRTFDDPTVRAILQIVQTYGSAYTAPATLWAALDALPQDVSPDAVEAVLLAVPDGGDVELSTLLKLKDDVDSASIDRRAVGKIDRVLQRFGANPRDLSYKEIREALELAERSQVVARDHTATGIRARLTSSAPKVRWQIGCADLDEALPGINKAGEASNGLLGQGEVTVLAGQYGSNKSRIVHNWIVRCLDTGASVGLVILEDEESSIATKLMGVKFNLPFWKIEAYARGQLGFLFGDVAAERAKLDAALNWFDGLGSRLRIYDGDTKSNVYHLDETLKLLELDARLYGTDVVVIDYVQQLKGGATYENSADHAQQLRAFAGRNKVALVELSQLANDTIKYGSSDGQVAAKGSGDWGAAAHIGLEVVRDFAIEDEFGLALKKARNAGRMRVYGEIVPDTGSITSWYGTPQRMALPEAKQPPKKKGSK